MEKLFKEMNILLKEEQKYLVHWTNNMNSDDEILHSQMKERFEFIQMTLNKIDEFLIRNPQAH